MDGTTVNYVAWAPNEPNFANNDENCVVMYTQTGECCNNIQSFMVWYRLERAECASLWLRDLHEILERLIKNDPLAVMNFAVNLNISKENVHKISHYFHGEGNTVISSTSYYRFTKGKVTLYFSLSFVFYSDLL